MSARCRLRRALKERQSGPEMWRCSVYEDTRTLSDVTLGLMLVAQTTGICGTLLYWSYRRLHQQRRLSEQQ